MQAKILAIIVVILFVIMCVTKLCVYLQCDFYGEYASYILKFIPVAILFYFEETGNVARTTYWGTMKVLFAATALGVFFAIQS